MAQRDAYRVNAADLEPFGGRKPENPDVTAEGLAEYSELKARLLREAALVGAAGGYPAWGRIGGQAIRLSE